MTVNCFIILAPSLVVATVTPPGLKLQIELKSRPRTWHLWVALVTTERSQLLFMECTGEIKWYLHVVTFSLTIEHIKQKKDRLIE